MVIGPCILLTPCIYIKPLITHFQLPLEHSPLYPSLSLEIQHLQSRIDHFSHTHTPLSFYSTLLPPASFRKSPFPLTLPFFSLITKSISSILISSSPLNVLNQQILIILPIEWLFDHYFSFLLF